MRFLVAYIVCGMSSLFLTLYVGNDLIQYGYSTYGHITFLSLFSFLSGAFLFLGIDKYLEVSYPELNYPEEESSE